MPKKISEYQRFMSLTDAQKDAEVTKYDHPLPLGPDGLEGQPLRARDKALHRRARNKARPGRPKIGAGTKIVPISIERGLLKDVDAFARIHKFKRSQLVAQGLRMVLGKKAG